MSDQSYQDLGAKREYEFWINQLGPETPASEYVTLTARDVLRAHFYLVDYFSGQGILLGGVGPRDLNLLESTVSRQFSGFGEYDKWDSKWLVIATLFFGIVRNHPFHDANKRTGLLSMLYHLERIGKCMTLSDREIEDFTVDMADHKLERHRRAKHRNRSLASVDAEVAFVARWLGRNSRNIDNEYRDITYNKLQSILNRCGHDIVNPQDNHIDLARLDRKNSFLGLGKMTTVQTRIRRVGFHSWKSTVPKGIIKVVREAADLTFEKGIDSEVFYNTEDPIEYLVGRYETPLRNLADR